MLPDFLMDSSGCDSSVVPELWQIAQVTGRLEFRGRIMDTNGRNVSASPCRLKLLACEIMFREFCSLVASSKNRVDVEFLSKGLHDVGRAAMSSRIRQALEAVNEREYDAILLGYALCSGGVVGLEAKSIPLILPRAHDCITLFLGDRRKYDDYFFANPGTYFKTTGWIERGENLTQALPGALLGPASVDMSLQTMIERYGEKNARYLWEQLTGMPHYSKMAFIETGIEPNDYHEQAARNQAGARGLAFDKLQGDLSLLRRLVDGPWDDDFLIVPPGHRIDFSYTGEIVRAVSEP